MSVPPAEYTYLQAIDAALYDAFEADERILFFGTSVPPKLLEAFGPERVRQSPISEPALTGAAVGAAIRGMRTVVWLRNVAFSYVAMDALMNHASKLHYMTDGQVSVPLLARVTTGAGTQSAAQHSQTPHGAFTGVAGLRVIAPGDSQTVYSSIRQALRSGGPTVLMESQALDAIVGSVDPSVTVPATKIYREGADLTIVAISGYLPMALAAAEVLAQEGIDCAVVHPVRISPLDLEAVRSSVTRTRRLLLLDEAPAEASVAANVIAGLTDLYRTTPIAIDSLHAAPSPVPFSPALESAVIPRLPDVLAAAHRLLT